MSFRRIEYFLSVAKHLNFTKAAKECYVAQAAISQQIKQYEQELGFPLFLRGGASVTLTPAGEYLYHQCGGILAHYNGAVEQTRAIAEGRERALRIGFHMPYPHRRVTEYLRLFRRERPDVSVLLQEGPSRELMGLLLSGERDVLVVTDYGMPFDEQFDTVELSNDRARFMIGPDSPLFGRPSLAPEELTGQTILRVRSEGWTASGLKMTDYYSRLGLGSCPTLDVKNFQEAVLMVEAGMGIAVVPPGAEERLPDDVSAFTIQGDTFRLSTVAVRLIPPRSVEADAFFRLMRREGEV